MSLGAADTSVCATVRFEVGLMNVSTHISRPNARVRSVPVALLLLAGLQRAYAIDPVVRAASRYLPGIGWRAASIVKADFTCQGRIQTAIAGAGADPAGIVVAVFLNGMNRRPVVIRDRMRVAASLTLTLEDLDYDPREDPGYELPGFQRSKTCKGLRFDDGETDAWHVYWNHNARRFDVWSH